MFSLAAFVFFGMGSLSSLILSSPVVAHVEIPSGSLDLRCIGDLRPFSGTYLFGSRLSQVCGLPCRMSFRDCSSVFHISRREITLVHYAASFLPKLNPFECEGTKVENLNICLPLLISYMRFYCSLILL